MCFTGLHIKTWYLFYLSQIGVGDYHLFSFSYLRIQPQNSGFFFLIQCILLKISKVNFSQFLQKKMYLGIRNFHAEEKKRESNDWSRKKNHLFPRLCVILIKGSFILQWFMPAFKSKVILLLLPWQNRSALMAIWFESSPTCKTWHGKKIN